MIHESWDFVSDWFKWETRSVKLIKWELKTQATWKAFRYHWATGRFYLSFNKRSPKICLWSLFYQRSLMRCSLMKFDKFRRSRSRNFDWKSKHTHFSIELYLCSLEVYQKSIKRPPVQPSHNGHLGLIYRVHQVNQSPLEAHQESIDRPWMDSVDF